MYICLAVGCFTKESLEIKSNTSDKIMWGMI